jgi:hypothetical protein
MSRGNSSRALVQAIWLLALSLTASGCYHCIVPVCSAPLPVEEGSAFPPGTVLRLEGGYDSRALLEIRTEGAHVLEADLREWTAKLLVELQLELRRRGADAIVSESSVEGTSVILPEEGENLVLDRRPDARRTCPVLRVWVSHLGDPSATAETEPLVMAEVESADTTFSASYVAEAGSRTYSAAFLSLKKKMIEDARLRGWLSLGSP